MSIKTKIFFVLYLLSLPACFDSSPKPMKLSIGLDAPQSHFSPLLSSPLLLSRVSYPTCGFAIAAGYQTPNELEGIENFRDNLGLFVDYKCLGVRGLSSGATTLEATSNTNFNIEDVPTGGSQNVKIFGVNLNTGFSCFDANDRSFARLFKLGAVSTIKMLGSASFKVKAAKKQAETLEVINKYSLANPDALSDIYAGCISTSSALTLTSVSPTTGSTAGGTSITLTGTGFVDGATVTVGGTACTSVSVVSPTSITCTTPSGTAGAKDIVVTVGSQSATLSSGFTYASGAPTLISISPSSAGTKGGCLTTITGTNFSSGATVAIGGVTCTSPTVVNSSTITCITDVDDPGIYDVVVTTGGTSPTLTNGFTVNAFLYAGFKTANGGIYAFTIHPTTGALTQAGSQYLSTSTITNVANDKDWDYIYANDATTIHIANVNKCSGALTLNANSPFNPQNGRPVNAIAVNPFYDYLYALVWPDPVPNTEAFKAYSIGAGGALTQEFSQVQSSSSSKSLTVDALGKWVFHCTGLPDSSMTNFYSWTTTNGLPSGAGVTTGFNNRSTSFATTDSTGAYLYTSHMTGAGGNLDQFTFNQSNGAVAAPPPPNIVGGDGGIVRSSSGTYLYNADTANGVYGYSINGGTGKLTALAGSPFASGGRAPYSVAIEPLGTFLYALEVTTIDKYSINSGSGVLSSLTTEFSGGTAGASTNLGNLVIF